LVLFVVRQSSWEKMAKGCVFWVVTDFSKASFLGCEQPLF
jgi:hypothetical protein